MRFRRPGRRVRGLAVVLGALALAAAGALAARRTLAEYDAADAQSLLNPSGRIGADDAVRAEAEAVQARALEPGRAGAGTLVARAIVAGVIADGTLSAADRDRLTEASSLLREDLAIRPEDGEAWLWLAYVQGLSADGGADEATRAALRNSYEKLPYPPLDLLLWRTRFAADLWPQLDPDLRSVTLDRLSAAWSVERTRDQVQALQQQITDPAGRTAVALRLLALQDAELRRTARPPPPLEPPAAATLAGALPG